MEMNLSILAVVLAFAAYPLLRARLLRFVEPWRLEMAELGEQLRHDAYLSERQKLSITESMDRAYSPWPIVAIVLTAPALPFVILWCIFTNRVPKKLTKHPETERDYERFMDRWFVSSMAANPAFGLIFLVEIVFIVLVIAIVGQQVSALRAALDVIFGWESSMAHQASELRA